MIKSILSMLVGFGLFTNANAAMLPGNFIPGGSMLSCNVYNTTGTKQRIIQVEYRYYCEQTPTNPGGYQWQTSGCMGFCEIESGHTSYQNGPFSWCRPLFGNCQAWSQEVPEEETNQLRE